LPLSVIIADVNNLKLTNDAFGHKTGDLLLKKVAKIMKSNCRKEDVIARWGGDEFAILLPKTKEESALEIISRIKKTCEKSKLREITISLSIGLAVKKANSQNIEDIIIQAEDRMYKEKLAQSKIIPEQIISFLIGRIFEKNIDSKERLSRITRNAVLLARNMDMPDNDLKNLEMLIQLNNIGYAAINKKIFFKAEKLTEKEWQVIKKHPEIGYRITETSSSLAHIANDILAHHESWDGTGYPLGLKNEQIPLHCRIFSVLETYDVIVYGRPYKQAMNKEYAMKELKKCSGKQFDPMIVDMFIEVIRKSTD
jgi:diguanylate cyclase (GGDEF)-like protein